MKQHWPKLIFLLAVISAIALARYYFADYLTVDNIKHHRAHLLAFISYHYIEASVCFILLFMATGLFLPGTLALTIAGGMMFGVLPTVVYAVGGATIGGTMAFLLARFMMAAWIQERFERQLIRFNEEMARHQKNYLLVLRVLPIAPFFVINYCAGMTKVPLATFVWTTCAGMMPGALVHAVVGYELRNINALSDLLSWKLIGALIILPVFALVPVVKHHWPFKRKQMPSG